MIKFVKIFILLLGFVVSQEVSGVTYFEYDHKEDFSLNRQYISFKNKLNESINLKVTLDVGRDNSGKLETFLKKSQLNWNCDGVGKFSFGLIGVNAHGVQEKNWGYRYIQKSSIDLWGFTKTADLGIGFSRKFFDKLSLSLQLTNGEGYKKPQGDRYSRTWVNVTYGEKNLSKNPGYNLWFVYSSEPQDTDVEQGSRVLTGLFAGYSNSKLMIGVDFHTYNDRYEWDLNCDEDDCESKKWEDRSQQSVSFSSTYTVSSTLSAFARFDIYDPNLDFEYACPMNCSISKEDDNENYVVAGIIWSPVKGLDIAPNVRHLKVDSETTIDYKINFQFKL